MTLRILVLGASGATGQHVIKEALSRGHNITALVRNPDKLKPKPGLDIARGSPVNEADIDAAFEITPNEAPKAIIVTLSNDKNGASMPSFMADSVANSCRVMEARGLRKIAIMASFGSGNSFPHVASYMKLLISRVQALSITFADHAKVALDMKQTKLDYIIARPMRLTNGAKTPVRFWGEVGENIGFVWNNFGSVSRASVASFLIDAVEESNWNNTTPVISG